MIKFEYIQCIAVSEGANIVKCFKCLKLSSSSAVLIISKNVSNLSSLITSKIVLAKIHMNYNIKVLKHS